MSTLTWKLSTAPTQTPEYWLLLVDGFACTALIKQAPYKGPGTYVVDLTQLDAGSPVPTDNAPHDYSVALVGAGAIGPLSASVSVTLPPPAAMLARAGQQSLPVVELPAADSLALI